MTPLRYRHLYYFHRRVRQDFDKYCAALKNMAIKAFFWFRKQVSGEVSQGRVICNVAQVTKGFLKVYTLNTRR